MSSSSWRLPVALVIQAVPNCALQGTLIRRIASATPYGRP